MSVSSTRRTVLKGAVVLAVLPVVGFTTERRRSPILADPFTLGVASGEPTPDGAVIWTRLAPSPLADDGLGGMPARFALAVTCHRPGAPGRHLDRARWRR